MHTHLPPAQHRPLLPSVSLGVLSSSQAGGMLPAARYPTAAARLPDASHAARPRSAPRRGPLATRHHRLRCHAAATETHETDVVVIGGGLGGLCAGALLAKYGLRVTVCESHSIPGGAAHAWHRDGYTFESGPSLYSGMTARPSMNPIGQVRIHTQRTVPSKSHGGCRRDLPWAVPLLESRVRRTTVASRNRRSQTLHRLHAERDGCGDKGSRLVAGGAHR